MDEASGANKVRNFYLQYPLNFRRDAFVIRLEHKFGLAAPMIWLEMNAYSADKGFTILKDPDEDWASQFVMDLGYGNDYKEQARELFEKVLQYAIKKKEAILTKTDDEESLYFPWAERQTMSRTMDAEKQARYRDRQREKEESSSSDRTKSNICYSGVTPVLPSVTGQVTAGNSPVTNPNECYHSKNKNIDKDKEKEKETDLEIDGEGEAPGPPNLPEEPPPIPPPKNLIPITLFDGTRWIPNSTYWGRVVVAFGDLNLIAEFMGMDTWIQGKPGKRLPSSERPELFVWRWLEKSEMKKARIVAEGIARARADAERKSRTPVYEDRAVAKARSQQDSFAAAFRTIREEEEAEKRGEGSS